MPNDEEGMTSHYGACRDPVSRKTGGGFKAVRMEIECTAFRSQLEA